MKKYQKKQFDPKPCKFCKKSFTPKRPWHDFDSSKCRMLYWKANKEKAGT